MTTGGIIQSLQIISQRDGICQVRPSFKPNGTFSPYYLLSPSSCRIPESYSVSNYTDMPTGNCRKRVLTRIFLMVKAVFVLQTHLL